MRACERVLQQLLLYLVYTCSKCSYRYSTYVYMCTYIMYVCKCIKITILSYVINTWSVVSFSYMQCSILSLVNHILLSTISIVYILITLHSTYILTTFSILLSLISLSPLSLSLCCVCLLLACRLCLKTTYNTSLHVLFQ